MGASGLVRGARGTAKLKYAGALQTYSRLGMAPSGGPCGSEWVPKSEVQNGAFFDRGLCNARRFATPEYLLVCGYNVSDWQIRNQSGSITLAPCRAAIGGIHGLTAAQERRPARFLV
jgi:hypothetical protein